MTYVMEAVLKGSKLCKRKEFVNRALMFAYGRKLEQTGKYDVHYYKVKVEEIKAEKKLKKMLDRF